MSLEDGGRGAPMPKEKSSESEWPDLPGEPEGWRALQQRARSEPDPRKLEAIIAEMNQLLTKCEKRAVAGEGPHPAPRRGRKQTSGAK
jgi:hypothetical protein